MSTSDPASPSDLTTPSAPPSSLSPSDSAPPPSASLPLSPPPRNYSTTPLILSAPAAYAPNSSVPRFLRLLAAVVLVGGSVAAAATWVYRTIIFPRLLIALKARTTLFDGHRKAYETLLDKLKGVVGSKGQEKLGGKEAVAFRERLREEEASKAAEGSEGVKGEEQPVEAEKAVTTEQQDSAESPVDPPRPLPPTPLLLLPLSASLSLLSRALSPSSTTPSPAASTSKSNLVAPTGTLLRTLVSFNEYLDGESYAASTVHSYRGGGGGGTGYSHGWQEKGSATGERKALEMVKGEVKGEIRALKGALLNRRNFSRPQETFSTTA